MKHVVIMDDFSAVSRNFYFVSTSFLGAEVNYLLT